MLVSLPSLPPSHPIAEASDTEPLSFTPRFLPLRSIQMYRATMVSKIYAVVFILFVLLSELCAAIPPPSSTSPHISPFVSIPVVKSYGFERSKQLGLDGEAVRFDFFFSSHEVNSISPSFARCMCAVVCVGWRLCLGLDRCLWRFTAVRTTLDAVSMVLPFPGSFKTGECARK
jgi:hypothetical protein